MHSPSVTQILGELQLKIASLELQASLLKPMVQQVADLISTGKQSMDTSFGSFKRTDGTIGQEDHNNPVLPDWRKDFSCSIAASEPSESFDFDENTFKSNWKNLLKKDVMKQGIMASHLKSDNSRLSSAKQPTGRVQGMIDSLVRQPSSHYHNANADKRRNSNDSALSKSRDLKSTTLSLTGDETTKIFPSKLIQQKRRGSTASIEDASKLKDGSKQFTKEEKSDRVGSLAFPNQSVVEILQIRSNSSLDDVKYGAQDRLENENSSERKTSQNVVSSIDRHFVSMKNSAKKSELSNELRMSSREKISSMDGESEFETSSSCSVAVSSLSMTSQTTIPNETKITIHTTVPIKIESKNYKNGDSKVLETQNSESLQVPHFQALPSHNLDPGDSFSKSSLSRRASVAILSVIRQVGTTATYTEKGSLAVLEDDSSISLIESDIVESETIWNTGFNPLSMFSVNWDFIIALLEISVIWIIPVQIAFSIRISSNYSLVLTIFFVLDCIIELFTFRISHTAMKCIKNPTLRDWQQNYVKAYLVTDLISSFPFEILPLEFAEYLMILRFLHLRRLPTIMLNSPKFIVIRRSMEKTLGIGQAFSGIFPLMFCLFAFLHLQACSVFFIGSLSGFSNSAIAQIQYKPIGDQYTWALFTAVGNTFPLAYKPVSTLEMLVVLVFIMLGAGLYACIVGTISSFAMGVDASGRLFKQKMDELKEYMQWKDISEATRRKVLKYYEIKYRGKFFEEKTLLSEMNESLRMEIAAQNCRELISKVSFLKREVGDGRDELFLGRIATSLTACYFVPGDIIVTQGEIGHEMYFIFSGTVDIIVNFKKVASFGDGAFFGELALIANIPRTATVMAGSSCMLYRLTRPDFTSILNEFDDMRIRIDIIYNERMAKVKIEEEARRSTVAKLQVPNLIIPGNEANNEDESE